MLKALLIDDEPDARADLRQLLATHSTEVEIVGEAETMDEIEALLARSDYDVVFLDVQLRGGTAFDLVPRIRPQAWIVFVTAFDRYALRAFEVNALDYLLKPIHETRLAATLRRMQSPAASRGIARFDPAPSAAAQYQIGDTVLLRSDKDLARFVRLREIAVIASSANYTLVRLVDGSRSMVRRTLSAWEEQLPSDFLRVHRTAIVNLHAVERATHYDRLITHLFVAGAAEPVRARREDWPEIEKRLGYIKHATA